MPSKVYFADRRSSHHENLVKKVGKLFDHAGGGSIIEKNTLVGIKLHFGERGGTTYIHPVLVRRVVEKVREAGGKPFLCDTNTLYTGGRSNAVDHLETALQHGFAYATAGAPVVIADGLRGRDYLDVRIDGGHFETVQIGSAIVEADALVVLSHVKGHMLTGFGGALKNLGMGCGARAGKQKMHSSVKPEIKPEKCTACKNCLEWCSAGAITVEGREGARINPELCTGCGECLVSCGHAAVKVQWRSAVKDVSERMVEYAAGAVKGKAGRLLFMNFLMDVIPDCDCSSWSDSSIVPDIGILASTDPLAIDQASVDLVNDQAGIPGSALEKNLAPGEDKFNAIHPNSNYIAQLTHAVGMGLGSREYELLNVAVAKPSVKD